MRNPPSGYRFFTIEGAESRGLDLLSKLKPLTETQPIINRLVPVPLIKSRLEAIRRIPSTNTLTYALDHCILREVPWVVEFSFELPYVLAGSENHLRIFRSIFRRRLLARNCRKILFQLSVGKDAFLQTFGSVFSSKTALVPRGAAIRPEIRRTGRDRVRILFVNSANINTQSSFFMKGGPDVIESYMRLVRNYANVELTFRSPVPANYRQLLIRLPNVRLLERPVSAERLEYEWQESDIFLHPHYITPSYAIIDAMSHGLPVVTTDTWGTSELVIDGKQGFVVHNPLAANFTDGAIFHQSDPTYFRSILRGYQEPVVKALVERLSRLVEHHALREEMGHSSYTETTTGGHSMQRRNLSLAKQLDELYPLVPENRGFS